MPTTLRARTGFCEADSGPRVTQDDDDRSPTPGFPTRAAQLHRRLDVTCAGVVNSIAGWIGVAIALSIALYASEYARDQGSPDSVVTTWVAGVVAALAVVPSVLFAVSAHRDMRRCWIPAVVLVIPALLSTNLVLSGV
jgi:hypothetical protein